MKPKTMILMVVAIGCGLGASYMTSRLLAERGQHQEIRTVTVMVAKKNLEMGTSLKTAAELFDELAARHGLSLARSDMRVAINEEFGDWQQPLASGDRVVFIPPVAGG